MKTLEKIIKEILSLTPYSENTQVDYRAFNSLIISLSAFYRIESIYFFAIYSFCPTKLFVNLEPEDSTYFFSEFHFLVILLFITHTHLLSFR